MPFLPTNSFAQLVVHVMIVSYASANLTIGVSCFLIYVLQQVGIVTV